MAQQLFSCFIFCTDIPTEKPRHLAHFFHNLGKKLPTYNYLGMQNGRKNISSMILAAKTTATMISENKISKLKKPAPTTNIITLLSVVLRQPIHRDVRHYYCYYCTYQYIVLKRGLNAVSWVVIHTKKGFRHLTFSSPSFVISQLILSVGGTEKKKKRILHMSCQLASCQDELKL